MKNYGLSEELRELYREELFKQVRIFENKYTDLANRKPHLWSAPTKAALYNFALSLLNHEYYKLDKQDREIILKEYEKV